MKPASATAVFICILIVAAGCTRTSRDDLIQEGTRNAQEKNYRGAVVLFKSILENDEKDLEARFLLADAYLNAGKLDLAEREFARVATGDPAYPGLSLRRAELFLLRGSAAEALREVEAFHRTNPTDATSLSLRGRAQILDGKPEAAEESLREAARLLPGDRTIRLLLADCLGRQGKDEAARDLLQELIRENEIDPEPYLHLAGLENARGESERALALFRKAAELNPEDLYSKFMIGLLLLEKGAVKEAEPLAADLLLRFPNEPRALQLKGFLLYLKEEYDESAMHLQRIAERYPDLLTFYVLGLDYLQLGKPELAVTQFQRILDYRPRAVQARTILGLILLQQGRSDEAINELRLALQTDERHALAHHVMGSALLAEGMYDQAMAEFDRAIELDPRLVEAHLQKGFFTLSRGDIDRGEGYLVQALSVAPELPNIRLILARHYLQQNKYAEASRTLREGLTGGPSDALLYNSLAAASFGQKKSEEAVAFLEKAKAVKSDYFSPYYNLATYYAGTGDYQKARRECQAVLGIDPREVKAWLLMAQIAERAGRPEEALSYYRQAKDTGKIEGIVGLAAHLARRHDIAGALGVVEEALRTVPNDPRLRLKRAGLLEKVGDYRSAAAEYEEILRAHPDQPPVWFALGSTYDRLGNRGEAARCYREVISRHPEFVPALNNLAYLYADNPENREEAVRLAERANRREPDNPWVMDTLGYAYLRQGRLPEARSALERAAGLLTAEPAVHYHLGLVQHRLGRPVQALASLQRALELGSFVEAGHARELMNEITAARASGNGS